MSLDCARPGALWALLLPFVFLALVRLVARPPERATGTLELWQELAPERPSGARARGRFPPWALLTALALLCAALAWLGPRGARAAAPRAWTCVVDRSPSMGLPLAPGAGTTRLAAALASAEAWLAENAASDERVRWLAPERAPLELARGTRPPGDWLEPETDGAEPERGEPVWERHDRPGTLWLTDRAPRAERMHAGLFASGGAAVPGPIAADARETVVWEDGALRTEARPRSFAVLVREAAPGRLPPVLERMLTAWCAARGFELVRSPRADVRLVIEVPALAGSAGELALARDGWQATGTVARRAAAPDPAEAALRPHEDWLVGRAPGGSEHAAVRARRGHVEVLLGALSEPAGDPALFALSWARLLERSLLCAPGVLALEERLAAGEALVAPGEDAAPEAARGRDAGSDLGPYLDAGLALAAGLAVAVAWLGARATDRRAGGRPPVEPWRSRRRRNQ
jgi:hypothetical protein